MSTTEDELINKTKVTFTQKVKKASPLFQKLPAELLEAIYGMLSFQDGKVLYHVNKATKNLVKNKHFEWADGRRLDFLLMMDGTGSMGAYLESAKLTLRNIIGNLRQHERIQKENEAATLDGRKKYHLRTAWLEYRDIKDDVPVRLHPFIENSAKIETYIANSTAVGGDDYPENVAGALEHALQDLKWTTNRYCHAVKVIMLVLDAPPHGMGGTYKDNYPDKLPAPYENTDWIKIAHQMRKENIIVHTVLCKEDCDQLNLFGTTISNITGGKCVYMKDARDLAEYIVANISADIELEEIISKKLKEIAPKMNDNEQEKNKLAERLFQIISEDRSLMVPSSMARTVTHTGAVDLASTPSISAARGAGLLQKPGLMERCETDPMSEKSRLVALEKPIKLDRSKPMFLIKPKDCKSDKEFTTTEIESMKSMDLSSMDAPAPLCRTFTTGGSLLFSYRSPSSARSAHTEAGLSDAPVFPSWMTATLGIEETLTVAPPFSLPLTSIAEDAETDEEDNDIESEFGDTAPTLSLPPLETLAPVSMVPVSHVTSDISVPSATTMVRSETAPAVIAPHAIVSESLDSTSAPIPLLRRTVTEVMPSEALQTRIASMIHQRRAI